MPEIPLSFARGLAVPVAQIERELKHLWKDSGGGTTRASLINLAIYCEGEPALAENTALIAELTQDHACRAILIAVEPEAPQDRVQSWISAHCHLSRAGAKQVCCEQITFLLEGKLHASIPNIVFSHLDSDLPLYLWLRAELPEQVDEQLWSWVDRLIIDSATWPRPAAQMAHLQKSLTAARSRLILRDLNWTRLSFFRQTFAILFDDCEHQRLLPEIESITIEYHPGDRTAALLLLGWFSGQLGWPCRRSSAGEITLARRGKNPVRAEVKEVGADATVRAGLQTPGTRFEIRRPVGSTFLEAEVTNTGQPPLTTLFPGSAEGLLPLLNEELMRAGKDVIYRRALAAILPLLD